MAKSLTLTAKNPIKYGPNGETAEPGEPLTVDETVAARLVELGVAELAAKPEPKPEAKPEPKKDER